MTLVRKLKRAIRGDVSPTTATLEILRRTDNALRSRAERSSLKREADEGAKLRLPYSKMNEDELVAHFRSRSLPRPLPGFASSAVSSLRGSIDTSNLIQTASEIANDHCWEILGFGKRCFGQTIDWNQDLLSGFEWPQIYHRDITFLRVDGSDARVLWELNRLGHLLTLARAFAVTNEDRFLTKCLELLKSWTSQNPFGYGVNWACAMEVALRAMNLLTTFELIRSAPRLTPAELLQIVDLLYLHGKYIRRNLEFSYIATSNHYMSDVVGLLWLGIMMPEFHDSEEWRMFGLREMLREMDKQILRDGADFEASTGYHRYILELLLYTFILCRENQIAIAEAYWTKLHSMLEFTRTYLRPDGFAPLIGDTDSGQVLPVEHRSADDHAYLLSIGATVFNDPRLKLPHAKPPNELFWILGNKNVESFNALMPERSLETSKAFPYAGIYVMRHQDLYLCFNASDAGVHGRGSHGHNDAMSIEVSAFGRSFLADPGTYVYGADRAARHRFRSTRYHSTVQIDEEEQNSTDIASPFVIGNESHPLVVRWDTNEKMDTIVAEHHGYRRLRNPVVHRRTVIFHKEERTWILSDEFFCDGDHQFDALFHFSPGLKVKVDAARVIASDNEKALEIASLNDLRSIKLLEIESSVDYGQKSPSIAACWSFRGKAGKFDWRITPIG